MLTTNVFVVQMKFKESFRGINGWTFFSAWIQLLIGQLLLTARHLWTLRCCTHVAEWVLFNGTRMFRWRLRRARRTWDRTFRVHIRLFLVFNITARWRTIPIIKRVDQLHICIILYIPIRWLRNYLHVNWFVIRVSLGYNFGFLYLYPRATCDIYPRVSRTCGIPYTHPTLWFLFKVYTLGMILKANTVSVKQISTRNAMLTHCVRGPPGPSFLVVCSSFYSYFSYICISPYDIHTPPYRCSCPGFHM